MKIAQIIDVLNKRITYLHSLKAAAYAEGDLDRYNKYEMELTETQATIDTLKPHIE